MLNNVHKIVINEGYLSVHVYHAYMSDFLKEIKNFHDSVNENKLEIFISVPRLAILIYLEDGERRRLMEIGKSLCDELDMSNRAILHHLELLVENKFAEKEIPGVYRITNEGKNILNCFRFVREEEPGA